MKTKSPLFTKKKSKQKRTSKTSQQQKNKLNELLYKEEVNGEKRVNKINIIVLIFCFFVIIINAFLIEFHPNYLSNFIGIVIVLIYNIILFFLLKNGIYKSFFKYITVFMNINLVTFVVMGYSIACGWVHTLRTCTLLGYFLSITLSGFYQRPKVAIYAGILAGVEYTLMFFYAIFFTNTQLSGMETFYEPAIGYDILIVYVFIIVLSGIFVSYITKRLKIVLDRALYSEAESYELGIAKQAIEEASKQKTNFLINILHEIKTPLTLIKNSLNTFIKKHGLSPEIEMIKQNVDKLQRDTINSLDSQKLERGQIFYDHNQIINLTDMLKAKIDLFKEIAIKKNVKITSNMEKNIYVKIDSYAMDRVINNIIDNAIKYNNLDGKIDICLKTNNNKAAFIVDDTGIGISTKQQKHIFEPYYQISHVKRNIQGIGMGLNIVKMIIQGVNGEIKVNSKLDQGTTFKVILQKHILSDNDITQENIEYSKPIHSVIHVDLKETKFKKSKHNILFVEDNLQMLTYLQNNMQEKYNVFYATNGKEALEKIESIPKPHIIIADIMMDEMDGYKFFKALSKNNNFNNIPFIFLTAKTTPEDIAKGFELGSVDYITKPFNLTELLARIKSHIELMLAKKELTESNKKLETLSRIDYLTQLSNRMDMLEKVENEKARFKRSNNSFSIVLCDIDDFKKFNDTYGHDCGDFILVSIANTIKSILREQDNVARWGGEEFLLLLPDSNMEGAKITSEKIREKIASTPYYYNDIKLEVTMTFGVSVFDNDSIDIDYYIAKADKALYKGKKSGKNCVVSGE